MLNVLIVESDPVIAMDLCDSVRGADPDAQVTVHAEPLAEVEYELDAAHHSHAFLRMPKRVEHDVAVRVARRLGARGTRVVLHGAEAMPDPLRGQPCISVMTFPFTARDVARCLDGCGQNLPFTA